MNGVTRAIFCLAVCLIPIASRAADVPLDDAGFTAYVQKKLQLQSQLPVTIAGPLSLKVTFPTGGSYDPFLQRPLALCAQAPDKCDGYIDTYVGIMVQEIQTRKQSSERNAALIHVSSDPVPADEAGYLARMAAVVQQMLPGDKVDIDDRNCAPASSSSSKDCIRVKRQSGPAVSVNLADIISICMQRPMNVCDTNANFRLSALRNMLSDPDMPNLRILLHVVAGCSVVESIGVEVQCNVVPNEDPLKGFFRQTFANLEEICFKGLPTTDAIGTKMQINGSTEFLAGLVPMLNWDRHTLDMSINTAIDLCEKATHTALAPLGELIQPLPSGGIGALAKPFAASYAIFFGDWKQIASASGGHLLIAVPMRDELLYSTSDSADDVKALGVRASSDFHATRSPVSTDVYRWAKSGWVLATPGSTMAKGPTTTVDVFPRQ